MGEETRSFFLETWAQGTLATGCEKPDNEILELLTPLSMQAYFLLLL